MDHILLLSRSFGGATVLRRIGLALAMRRQRGALARLDERLLDDAGIDPDAARAEAARPIWDVPQTWLR